MDFIYARQSVDKADSISIESQIEYCIYETRGGPYRVFQDRGFSGKNTGRPAFRQMMELVRQEQAGRVIVYKLDRISRSVLDFTSMMQLFQEHHVEFVSCTEKFDTSTPMGRAMLHICIVFAQLERETIQMRVADSYAARMRRGFFMGGHIPYGFRLEPAVIDGIHTEKYAVEPEEAEHIRLICNLYADAGNSIGDVVRYLQQNGIVNRRGRPWGRDRILETIRNPVYVKADRTVYAFYRQAGTVILSEPDLFTGQNGCFLFAGENGLRKQYHLEGARLVLAPHEGIVDAPVWLACRKRCMRNQSVTSAGNKAKWTWLSGKIKCALCGYALVVKNAPPYQYRYLVCSHRYNAHACSFTGVLHLDQIEAVVQEEVQKRLRQFSPLRAVPPSDDRQRAKLQELKDQIQEAEQEKRALVRQIPAANAACMKLINERTAELEQQQQEWARCLEALQQPEEQAGTVITDCAEKWDLLDFRDKQKVLDLLTERILVSRQEIHIIWRV